MAETPLHDVADRTAPRIVKSVGQAFAKMRDRVDVARIERALERGGRRLADAEVDLIPIEDALEPTAEIVRDLFMRGAKVPLED